MPWVSQRGSRWERLDRAVWLRLGAAVALAVATTGWWITDRTAERPDSRSRSSVARSAPARLIPTAAPGRELSPPEPRERVSTTPPVAKSREAARSETILWNAQRDESWSEHRAFVVTRAPAKTNASPPPSIPGLSPRPVAPPTLGVGPRQEPVAGTPPTIASFASPGVASATSLRPQTITRRESRKPALFETDSNRSRPVAGSGSPTVWARNSNGTQTVDVAALLGANRFYDAGYTGGNAFAANIEGGTAWRGHETLNWMPAGNIFWAGSALNETTPISTPTTPRRRA